MKKITCMCEHQFEADVPDEIDLEKHPDTVPAILNGTFMNLTCPSCRKVLKPEFPFRLWNPTAGWEIHFVPELKRQASIKKPPKKAAGKKTVRLVIGYSELIEKIKIFTAQLDDRVIEYLKYIILSKVLEKTDSEEKDVDVYFNERLGEELIFHIPGLKSEEVGIFKIPMATYAKALSEIDKRQGEEPFNEFLVPPYVSLNKLYTWDDV